MRVVTIGVYGYTADAFFRTLEQAKPDVFVDTRRRRAVRGAQYAFANSIRLQTGLEELGIPYVHRLDLAPTKEMVQAQDQADHVERIRRRDRTHLTDAFKASYRHLALDTFDSAEFIASLGEDVGSILIFCVERTPDACHRSLLAERLREDLGASVEHLEP